MQKKEVIKKIFCLFIVASIIGILIYIYIVSMVETKEMFKENIDTITAYDRSIDYNIQTNHTDYIFKFSNKNRFDPNIQYSDLNHNVNPIFKALVPPKSVSGAGSSSGSSSKSILTII